METKKTKTYVTNREKYTKEFIKQQSFYCIKEYQPSNITGLISLLDCSYETFYKKIKVESSDYNEIVEELKKEKEKVSKKLRKKLVESDNPTAIIAALKLYGNEDDRQALNQNQVNIKTTGQLDITEIKTIEGNLNKLTSEEIVTLNNLLDKIRK